MSQPGKMTLGRQGSVRAIQEKLTRVPALVKGGGMEEKGQAHLGLFIGKVNSEDLDTL